MQGNNHTPDTQKDKHTRWTYNTCLFEYFILLFTSRLTFQIVISRRNSTKYKKKTKDKRREKEKTNEKSKKRKRKPLQFIPLPHRYRLDRNWSSLVDSAIEGLLAHLSFRCSILCAFIISLVSVSQTLSITEQVSKCATQPQSGQ